MFGAAFLSPDQFIYTSNRLKEPTHTSLKHDVEQKYVHCNSKREYIIFSLITGESFFATGETEQEIGNKSKTRSNVVFLFSEGYIITLTLTQ